MPRSPEKQRGLLAPFLRWQRLGFLHRVEPIGPDFGRGRPGIPLDRYYINAFLANHAADIYGRVLEVEDNRYTLRYGSSRVEHSDVLHVTSDNSQATIVADLTKADDAIPSDHFDCVILTQVLPFIYDVRAATRTVHRILKHGGVVLATVPGIAQISHYDMDQWGEFWRFTTLSAKALFADVFGADHVHVDTYRNVLVAVAFLHGLRTGELRSCELDSCDPSYQVLITVRAEKKD